MNYPSPHKDLRLGCGKKAEENLQAAKDHVLAGERSGAVVHDMSVQEKSLMKLGFCS